MSPDSGSGANGPGGPKPTPPTKLNECPGSGVNAPMRTSGVVAPGEPKGEPESATGPTNLMLATVDQVSIARRIAPSKDPAPNSLSTRARSCVILLVPTTPVLLGKPHGSMRKLGSAVVVSLM